MKYTDLKIKIFADGADVNDMEKASLAGIVKGFTTNPTLMKKSGITDYEKFAKEAITKVNNMPISFEVFSDDFETMEKEAMKIAGWGENVYVKIPITNTKRESSINLIKELDSKNIKLNVTAILTLKQVEDVCGAFKDTSESIISVFAGRIADTGYDPIPLMKEAKGILSAKKGLELLWASSREVLNILQAEQCGCEIITVTNDLLKKLHMIGMDLGELSLDTVKMFYNDASSAGYKIL
ncbi:MAG: transaldolase [Ignavibacteriae bacterium]|nr:transaldolase [Ignavibacteriota bacterium]